MCRKPLRDKVIRYAIDALEQRRLFSAPPLPTIPSNSFNITTYGATANDATDDTTAIQNAINACHSAGGGTLTVPSGTFLSGPLTFFSSMNLNLASGSTLKALPYGTYPGSGTTSVSKWLNFSNVTNVEVSGAGTLDGQGSAWWTAYTANNTIARPRSCSLQAVTPSTSTASRC